MYHPIELNSYWQKAANQLKDAGYVYVRRHESVVPGVFVKGEESVYLIADTVGRTQHWSPTSESIPNEFNQAFASKHTGMSRITIKLDVVAGKLIARKAGARAMVISDAELLRWMRARPRRGGISGAYRTRQMLETSAYRSLLSILRSSVRARDIDFHMLFDSMCSAGVDDPESLMLSDLEAFYESAKGLDRQQLIRILEIDSANAAN